MADELDLKELRLEVQQLKMEIARLDKQKLPRRFGTLVGMHGMLWALALPIVVSYWVPMLGFGRPDGRFSSVQVEGQLNADGQVRAESIYLKDDSGEHKTFGMINEFGPGIALSSENGEAIRVEPDGITLKSERGTLILELNEKGEPVLRSIPKKR
jgi:hypothetical protein